MKQTILVDLRFVKRHLQSIRMMLSLDAAFENALGYKSQLGFLILLADDQNYCKIVHFGSARCKRVVLSVLSKELHTLSLEYDNAYVLRELATEIV